MSTQFFYSLSVFLLGYSLSFIFNPFQTQDAFQNQTSSIPTSNLHASLAKEQKYDLLQNVSVEVQASHISDLLGDPVYKQSYPDQTSSHTYVDPDYFVKIVLDQDQSVMLYAITARHQDFQPSFNLTGQIKITLNETTFAEWKQSDSLPSSCLWMWGNNPPFYYFEDAYYGNPGGYLTYWVGNSSAGQHSRSPTIKDPHHGFNECSNFDQEMRRQNNFNTLVVWRPALKISEQELLDYPERYFGPDVLKIRNLNE